MNTSTPFAGVVRDLVVAADLRRRRRHAGMLLARWSPRVAGALLLMALVAALADWPAQVVIGAALVAAVALVTIVMVLRRACPVDDGVAARIDVDAGLGGELRSAYWFARQNQDPGDEWVRFHLARAADALRARAWDDVYPSVDASRRWLAAGGLTLAALIVPLSVPSWPAGTRPAAASAATAAESVPPEALALIPPELQAQVLDLLAQMQAGVLRASDALERLKKLPGFTTAPPDVQLLLADALAESERRRQDAAAGSDPETAPRPQDPGDVDWARQNEASRLANELARSAEELPAEMQDRGDESTKTEDRSLGDAPEASAGQASAMVPTKDPAAAQGATGMMMMNGASGDPGSAFGGKKGDVRYGTVDVAALNAALKREQIEAFANVDTSDLRSEENRRRTEQSWSALNYSRVERRASFDRARIDAPQLVPEARRPLLERYFERPSDAAAPVSAGTGPNPPPSRIESSR